MLFGQQLPFFQPGPRLVDGTQLNHMVDSINDNLVNMVNVLDFGATGNGVMDDFDAFATALNISGISVIFVPPGSYRLSSGITIPAGKKLISTGFIPGNPPSGTKLIFDLSVDICVTLDGTGLTTVGFSQFTVTRAAGAIPAGSIGVLVNLGYQMNLDNIWSDRHAIGYKWLAAGSDGISSDCFRLYTGAITDCHVVVDSWPELRVSLSRFGMNGLGNQVCTAYVKITGGTGIGGIGPNSLSFNQCQFNQSANFPNYWLYLTDLVGEFTTAAEYKFQQCHIEGVTTAIVKTTSNVSGIDRFTLVNNTFNNPTVPFFDLDAATRPFQWFFSDNFFFCSTFNLTPTLSFQRITLTGGRISGTSSFTGAAGSILVIQGVYFSSALVFAGAWAMLYATGVIEAGVTDTSTGRKFLHLGDLLTVQNNSSASPADIINTLDAASVLVGKFRGARATPTNNDTLTHEWQLNNSNGIAVTAFRENIRLGTITAGAEAASVFWSIRSGGAISDKLQFTPSVLAPVSNDGLALGASTVSWADLFLASGGVINWNNGTLALTQSGTTLDLLGTMQMDALRIDQTPAAVGTGAKTISNAADSSTNFGHYLSVNANGTTYYIACSSVAPT